MACLVVGSWLSEGLGLRVCRRSAVVGKGFVVVETIVGCPTHLICSIKINVKDKRFRITTSEISSYKTYEVNSILGLTLC